MQISARESMMSASIPLMYVENSQFTEVGGNAFRYSKRKTNKIAEQLVIPSSIYYMCTGDKFVPISTDKPLIQPNINQLITKNFKQKSRTSSKSLAMPELSVPLNDVYNQNSNGAYLNVSTINRSKNSYIDKKNTIRTQEIPKSREYEQSLHTGRVFFTGTIERILRWNRNLEDIFCLYETIAPVISLQEGRIIHQKIMLLRDRKGPILQVQFFSSTHIDINDFYIGQYLRHKKLLIFGTVAAVMIAVIVIVTVILLHSSDSKDRLGAIVTNGEQCSDIGKSIFYRGGNAVDAAIASLFCEGVAMAQSCGLGGGFIMTIFQKDSGKIYTLNSREVAPAAATADMYHSNSDLSKTGILAVAVPGELRGYWRAYQRFGGGVPWRELIEPTIKLCREGIHVSEYLAGAFAKNRDKIYNDLNLRASYIDPSTNNTYIAGKYIKRPILADTLEIIANEGGDALHAGSLTDQFIADIKKLNGIITKEDMNNYEPVWEEPVKVSLPHGHTLYAPRLPSSGAVLAYILNMLQLKLDFSQPTSLVNSQRLIESFKFAYGMRTRLGDIRTPAMDKFVQDLTTIEKANLTIQNMKDNETSQNPEYYGAQMAKADNHGTAHISVLAPNGDAVSVTSTINYYFGSGVSTEHTDIILNDEMDDFASPGIISVFNIPPSVDNYIEPGKHPLSSMCPTIILDENNDVKLIIGAAGGTVITTSVAETIVRHLWYNMTIDDAIDSCRLHHQLFPMAIIAEECFKDDVKLIDFLTKIGHVIQWNPSDGFSAITAISTQNGISARYDRRRPGDVTYIF